MLLALGRPCIWRARVGGERFRSHRSFSAYRRTVLAPDELIAAIEIPKPLPEFVRFYKVAKRRMDDISTVAAAHGHGLGLRRAESSALRFAFGGVAAIPLRAIAAEEAILGQRWNDAAVERVQAALDRTLEPISDHRGSAEYRLAVAKSLVDKFLWERREAGCVNIAGKPIPHESARGHVTGEALYTDDLLARFPTRAARLAGAGAARARAGKVLDVSAALDAAGVVTVLTAEDVPGEGDSGSNRHDEPLFPTEVIYHCQPVAWVLGETLEAAQLGAARVSVEYEPLPAILTIEDAIVAGSFHSGPLRIARGDASVD